ncbi:MAG: hypothetical protein RI842_09255 [Schleiferiaceae bacterium]|nr:hypothetical protein [Schleiferiaceae bacterium]MDR9442896.1 hypothetical protein [Schleiferiaceae bacterium]
MQLKNTPLFATAALSFALLMGGCSNNATTVVDSGTYAGEVVEVEAEKTEIYVQTPEGKLELYFTEETQLTRNGSPVNFSELAKGDSVKVKVKKVGKRLDPLAVKIKP